MIGRQRLSIDKTFTLGRLTLNFRVARCRGNSYSIHTHFWFRTTGLLLNKAAQQ